MYPLPMTGQYPYVERRKSEKMLLLVSFSVTGALEATNGL
jgi:hypothetical protein